MNYTKGPIIGRGSTATVSLATSVAGDIIAVKSTHLATSSFLQKEQQFLSKLKSHPHVINYIGYEADYDNHEYNLFMEYASCGSISDVIKKQGGFLDESLIRSYTRQILLGLDHLHSNNLVHCDVKCANMLVCEDGVKIGDLGCAKLLENEGKNKSSVFSGTPVFMAPEVARGEKQGFEADVWAVGCVVIEMATGFNPWPDVNDPVSGLYRIGYSGDVPLFPVYFSDEGKDFLKKCLERNEEERWTVKQLLQHPFVTNYKKIETLSKNSPISVIDQGFWDSLEEPEASSAPSRFVNASGDSPVERIRQLVETTVLCLPDWVDEDDNWITVRNNHIDETLKMTQQNLNMVDDDDDMNDGDDESSLSVSYLEDLLLFSESYVEDDSLGSDVDVISSVVVSRFIDFKNMNDNNCLLIDSNLNFAIFGHLFLHIPNDYNLLVI
ncbi:hypothetical protein QVD17_05902 [Tagetes erecta]|uniref:Protein kinase domain-containing protein n=1 Tax=Tagetes erecta TaxID=13708 RepID=A0AAD8LEP1_TARER|nr:hypothetical protein QVD17_05902 [Tagetes erecta]